MKNLKHILLFLPLLLLSTSCEKLDNEKSELVVGKWKYVHTVNAYYPSFPVLPEFEKENFFIEFEKNGRLIVENNTEISKYTISEISDKDWAIHVNHDLWDKDFHYYGNGEGKNNFILYYFNSDTIGLDAIPFDFQEHNIEFGNSNLNLFARVE
jgi:hypothetical protein